MVWRNSAVVIAGYLVAIFIIDLFLLRRLVPSRVLAAALAFALVQTAVITIMLIVLYVWKHRDVARARRSLKLAPEIDDALSLHCIGVDQTERLRRLRDQSSLDVRARLFTVASATRGEARDRLTTLAAELQYVEHRAGAGMQAIRDSISMSGVEGFDQIIAWSSRQSLLTRAIVAEEVAPYVGEISGVQIALALNSSDRRVVLATLEMLRAWQRTMQVPGFTVLLASPDPRIRADAFAVLSYVAADEPLEVLAEVIVAGLGHADPRVRAAAARSSGRLGVTAVSAALAGCLDDSIRSVAVAAAAALASMGPIGLAILERELASVERGPAAVAFEAWEKATMGRLEIA